MRSHCGLQAATTPHLLAITERSLHRTCQYSLVVLGGINAGIRRVIRAVNAHDIFNIMAIMRNVDIPPFRASSPPRSGVPWGWLFFWLVFLAVLGGAVRLYLVHEAFSNLASTVGSAFHPVPIPAAPAPPPASLSAGASPAFPPSSFLRVTGAITAHGRHGYVATSAAGEYVVIPAANCQVLDGGPVCHYQGKTVTRYTGAQAIVP